MASSIDLYDDLGNPVSLTGEDVKQLLANNVGLGVNQVWSDFQASRIFGTTYTNNTGRAISISVQFVTINAYDQLELLIDGVGRGKAGTSVTSAGLVFTLTGIIPPGSTYSITQTGVVTLHSWNELREVV